MLGYTIIAVQGLRKRGGEKYERGKVAGNRGIMGKNMGEGKIRRGEYKEGNRGRVMGREIKGGETWQKIGEGKGNIGEVENSGENIGRGEGDMGGGK